MFKNWSASEVATKGINMFTKKSRICEMHFMDNDIIRQDVFEMDGSTVTVARKIPKLREGAVPSIFAGLKKTSVCPVYEEKRQTQFQTVIDSSISALEGCLSHENASNVHQNEDVGEVETWAVMKDSLESLSLPSEYWCPVIKEDLIVWICWTDNLSSCTRRIVLHKNMIARVFIGEKEINELGGKMDNVDRVHNLLRRVSNVYPCKEVNTET